MLIIRIIRAVNLRSSVIRVHRVDTSRLKVYDGCVLPWDDRVMRLSELLGWFGLIEDSHILDAIQFTDRLREDARKPQVWILVQESDFITESDFYLPTESDFYSPESNFHSPEPDFC
jgi:hypothetical protein